MNILDKKYENLIEVANEHRADYNEEKPFPNIVFHDFFDAEMLNAVLNEFPDLAIGKASVFDSPTEKKLAGKGAKRFGKMTKKFMKYLNSDDFLQFLQIITGIEEKLIPDKKFSGGGLHEIKAGGLLKLHVDFNKHSKTKLDRRINVLIYLNKEWKEEYGGHIEFWDKSMESCGKKILPVFNTMAIFSTTDFSYHGHPNPLNCPEAMSRKSLALYYYSDGRPQIEIDTGVETHGTIFKPRKNNFDDKLSFPEEP